MLFSVSAKAKSQHQRGEGSRIPSSLQAVFIASNRGADVVKPPPQKSAFKMFLSPKVWLSGKQKSKSTIPANRKSNVEIKKSAPTLQVSKVDSIPSNISVPRAPKRKSPLPTLTPQQYLESLLRTRGYSTKLYSVLSSAYYNKPTPLQQASYGVYLVDVVRRNDVDNLETLFAVGLHPNACNSFGESIVHLACRRGNYQALQTMIDFNCNIQVSDDYGRTPLHDLCWAAEPSLQAAAMILEIDRRMLFMTDSRGASPLAYARREHWAEWIRFLESRKDEYWPKRGKDFQEGPPSLTQFEAHARPLPDPENGLSLALAEMVSSGKMKPEEAEMIRDDNGDIDESSESESDMSTSSSDEGISDDDDDVDDVDDDSFFDEEEMAELISTLRSSRVQQ